MEGVEVKGMRVEVQEEVWKWRVGEKRWRTRKRRKQERDGQKSSGGQNSKIVYCIMITLVTYIHLYPHYLKVP